MPTITLMPRPLQPHPPHGQEPLHYMGNNPTGHPGVNPTNYSLLTPHPAQSHSGEMMTPAHSWIGPPPSAYPISLVPGVNNHQPWAPSPTGSNSRPSVSSQTSSLESAALSHEELQNTLQSVARALQLGYELVQWAQPLLEVSAALDIPNYVPRSTEHGPPDLHHTQPSSGSCPASSQTPTDQQFSSAFRTWVQETTRWVLLGEDLQSYGSRASRRLCVADTLFTRVQAELNCQDEAFHLPPNIAQGNALERLLCDTVKSEKAALAILIKVGLTGLGPPNPADRQIHSDKQRHRTLNRQKLFWDDINEDLARLRCKSSAYGVAYSQLIFNLDQATWTSKKTVNNVEEAAQQVPPHKEVQYRAATLVEEPNEEVALRG
ncbi:hypothetical protein PTTG_26941 [Puccinia triticina 1-1 BBBD Race 1]|uniref:Uncharacterized protein n=1 Tax=Puccinia triticina (isolate 1-1 / race 1 (BBBD)) TaxID=630390 RepID=A0A180GQ18_PUCT1|nr:hypothetical protein PTTG_26941 [Puccinia triticina 1-1 BBBD Race 1]